MEDESLIKVSANKFSKEFVEFFQKKRSINRYETKQLQKVPSLSIKQLRIKSIVRFVEIKH